MSDRIDIFPEIDALLDKLGVSQEWDRHVIRDVLVEPSEVTVTVYLPNENGDKHIVGSDYIAVGQRRFRVRTGPDQ